MHLIVELLKQTLQPASIFVFMLAFTIGVLLLYVRPRQGRAWLLVVTLGYWLLTTPVGASLLARTVTDGYAPLPDAASAAGATAVVMLGGGSVNVQAEGRRLTSINRSSALRAIETARVYHLLGDPLVIVSGGVTDKLPGAPPESDAYQSAMRALGVPAERVVAESESRNTHDEAVILKRMLHDRHIERFVLVTSALHMRRSLAVFAAQGLYPTPSPGPLHSDRLTSPFPLLPSDDALEIGNAVIYEWSARAYYWARGWMRPSAAAR
jgi:uncharacterized SAM-binding protein YcdF (DUF218 family)